MQITVKDIPVYYEVYGSGTPIVMIHGWSCDHGLMSGCMEPAFEGCEAQWQRIYLDLPGMGKTPARPWLTGPDEMLEIVLGVIDGLIPGQHFLVAGESYGGYLARGVIHERRSLVDGLLLLCPSIFPKPEQKTVPPLQILEKDDTFLNSLSEEEKYFFVGLNVVQTKDTFIKFAKDVLPGLKIANYDFLEHTLRGDKAFSFEVDKVEIPYEQPALFFMGRQDCAVGYRDQWRIIENFTRASFAIMDKAGHNAQIEQDVVFTALVKEWLERAKAEESK